MELQLGHDACPVRFRRFRRDAERRPDLLVGRSLRQQLEYLTLARGETAGVAAE